MDVETIEDCCQITAEVLDGKYGWVNEALAILAFMAVFDLFFRWVVHKLNKKFSENGKIWKACFTKALYHPFIYFVRFFAAIQIIELILHGSNSLAIVKNYTPLAIEMGGICAFGWFLFRWKHNVVRLLISKCQTGELLIDKGKLYLMDKVATVLVIVVVGLLCLEVSGRSYTTLLALGSVGGISLAFAAQEILSNFFGGLMIYITRPFDIGDWICLSDRNIEGHVEEIGWYMTRIRNFEKRPIYVPNSTFSKVHVITPSRMSHRQIGQKIGLRYSDLSKIRQINARIREMLVKHPDIDTKQKLVVSLNNFGASSVEIEILAYCKKTESQEFALIKEEILFKIYDIILENGADLAVSGTTIELPQGLKITST